MKPLFLFIPALLVCCPCRAQGLAGSWSNTAQPSPGINTGGANPSSTIGPSSSSIFLYGRVAMDDASELPLNVVIEKTCNGQTSALTYADRKGRFTVNLSGDSAAKYADASYDSHSTGSPNQPAAVQTVRKPSLVGCDLRASYPGFRSDYLSISSSRAMDSADLGTFILHKTSGSAASTISATFLTAPKDALKSYQKAMDDVRKNKPENAKQEFQKAVAIYPQFASAWYELGRLEMAHDDSAATVAAAQTSLRRAIAADPKYSPPYVELSFLAMRGHDWQTTLDLTGRALALDSSTYPQLYYFSAVANANLSNFDDAEKKARDAVRLDHDHRFPRALQLLAFLLERKGDLQGAAEVMRGFLATSPSDPDAQVIKTELASVQTRLNLPK
jgi:tetratricopeptide (TPR) repeat protein